MKPKPLVALNHLTVPLAMLTISKMHLSAFACTTSAQASSDFNDVLGSRAGSARSTRQGDNSNGGHIAYFAENASPACPSPEGTSQTALPSSGANAGDTG